MLYLLSALELLEKAGYDESYRDAGEERLQPILDEIAVIFKASCIRAKIIHPSISDCDEQVIDTYFENSEIVEFEIVYKVEGSDRKDIMKFIVMPCYVGRFKIIEEPNCRSGRSDFVRNFTYGIDNFRGWIKKGLRY